ncbi:MAG: DUF2705 family protein [Syntrophaceticus sp.]|nr:DUF2705 family protein [Syntrophaceticus sp.]MDD4782874.1 DUF2705 family protein [Syntrophaceticus sp.]
MCKIAGKDFHGKRYTLKLFLSGGLIAIFLGFYYSQFAEMYQFKSLELMLILAYGNLYIEEIVFIVPVFLWMVPLIVIIFFLGDYIHRNFDQNAAYIFTRTARRSLWLIGQAVNLFLYILIYYIFQIAVFCVVSTVLGFSMFSWDVGIMLIVSELALLVLSNYMIVLLINVLSLFKLNSLFCVAITLTTNIVCIFLSAILYKFYTKNIAIIKWLPFTQGILTWHSGISSVADFFPFNIPHFSILFSIVYLIIICLLLLFCGVCKIEKMDIY